MTESEAILPDAAGEIEIHFNSVQNNDMPTTSVPKIKRSTIEKSFFFSFPVSKKADTLEDLERKLLGKSPNEIFELFFDKKTLNLLMIKAFYTQEKKHA